MSSTATTTVKTKQRSPSSASQKFWPLKKFGLHHGKTEEQLQQQQQQQSIPLSSTKTNKESIPSTSPAENNTNKANKNHAEKNAAAQQKKTKNKRLSSLLSSNRRQEVANEFQNLQSHVNTPESIAADNTKKQINNASNTPTLTRKTGREISNRTRTNSQNTTATTNTTIASTTKHTNNMTAKSAGSGTLSRSNNVNSSAVTPLSSTAPLNTNKIRTKELRSNSVRRSSEERLLKRPQSPPTKKNEPAQPNIMLDSVQQKIQNEQYSPSFKKEESDVDNDSAIEEDNNESDCETDEVKIVVNDEKLTPAIEATMNKAINEKFDSPPVENNSNNEGLKSQLAELEPDSHEEYKGQKEENHLIQNDTVVIIEESKMCNHDEMQHQQKVRSLLPSPPNTPAATDAMLSEFTKVRDSEANSAAGIAHIHSEPASPTMYTFDVSSMHSYKLNDIDNYNQDASQSLFTQQQQQSIRRIRKLRPAASFATLRQLASTNNTYQLQQQQQQQFQSKQQIRTSKRRPVSYIESGNQTSYFNYANDEYLTVNRPNYYRRASSEDNRYFHTREQSDNTSTTTAATFPMQVGSRGLIRSNTVHNLIIKDGHGHRIIQCMGLDEPRTLRRKTSSFEGKDLFQQNQQRHDWSPPPEALDDVLFTTRQQQLEEQLLLIQQQQIQQQQMQQQQYNHSSLMNDNTDTSSSDSSSNHTSSHHRRIKRNDSAKSISSLCSSSPPITSYDSRFDKLRNKLDKERAIVKALQKQKEACNKDVLFLSKSVDNLTAENVELKKKFENEKVLKERFQDDLSSTMDKLNEATEHIRQLENQTKILKSEIDDKDKNIRELEKQKQQQPSLPKGKPSYSEGKSTDRLLAAQLLHSQNQVRLLKSTMEQFLRMGVFNDDLHSPNSNVTSPTTSIETVSPDFRSVGRSRQRRPSTHANKSSTTCASEDAPAVPPITTRSRKSLVPTDPVTETTNVNKTTKTPEKKHKVQQDETMAELDIQFRELLREKELLQAEYSKAPSSGGNALVRRRREELESRLDTVDSQMCRIKLQMRSRNIL